MELTEINGSKPNSKIYQFGIWDYLKCRSRGERYYCCQRFSTKKCQVVLQKDPAGNWMVDEENHNHPHPRRADKSKIINLLKRKSTETLSIEEMVKKVCTSYQNSTITLNAARKIVSRSIEGYQKEQPNTLFELSKMLETNDLYKQIFLREILTDDKKAIALLLGSKNLLSNIKTAESLTIDGSFRSLPVRPETDQLLTFYLHKGNEGITALCIICSEQSQKLYNSIFNHLKENKIFDNLKVIKCHYDNILISEIKKVFPFIKIKGSLYSFVKLLSRKWNSLDLPINYDHEIFFVSWIIKLLPDNEVDEVINSIHSKVEVDADKYEDLCAFVKFLKKCSKFIVKNQTYVDQNVTDAINYAEHHNIHMIKQLGSHNKLHSFLKLLRFDIKRNEKLLNNAAPVAKNNNYVRITNAIKKEQDKFKYNKQTIEKFKERLSQSNIKDLLMVQLPWPQCNNRNEDGKLSGFNQILFYLSISNKANDQECLYCFDEKACVQVVRCQHYIACMLCWISDYYVIGNERYPYCRKLYDKVSIIE